MTPQDITLPEVLEPLRNVPQLHWLAYEAPQGRFELVMPQAHCEVVDFDTTVEQLTEFIAQTLANENQGDTISVIGYEGVDKGAMAACLIK